MILRGEELMDYIANLLDLHKGELGLEYIVFGDGQLLPRYPCAVVDFDSLERIDHTTHYFLINIQVCVYLLHGNLGVDRSVRTRADLELTTRVVNLLHTDRTLGGAVVSSRVTMEEPGTISTKNETIIGTQITFVATNRELFR